MNEKYKEVFDMLNEILDTDAMRAFIMEPNYSTFWGMGKVLQKKCGEDIRFSTGLTKGVIINYDWDFVVKIPFKDEYSGLNLNYCALEYHNFCKAKSRNLDSMFAWMEKIGKFYGVPLYAQEYVACDNDAVEDEASELYFKEWLEETDEQFDDEIEARRIYTDKYDDYWDLEGWDQVSNLFYRDWDNLSALERFMSRYHINDIHTANVGYRLSDHKIVMIDYSGYGSPYLYGEEPSEYWN